MTSTSSPVGTPPVPPAPPAPTGPTPPPPAESTRPHFRPWTDSTLLLGGIGGLFYFAGWAYEQAFYKRFDIDPAIISTSSFTLALDGATAMLSTIAIMLLWFIIAPVVLMLLAIGADWLDRRYFPAASSRKFTALVITLSWSLVGATALMPLLGSEDAGARAAARLVRFVQTDQVWNYHLEQETISGVTIGQNAQATWILTKTGVRQVKTDAIRTIDGPLFKRVAESAGQPQKR